VPKGTNGRVKKLIAYRTLSGIPVLLLVSLAAFSLLHLMPGSPAGAILGRNATPERVLDVEQRLGLDRPFFEQYLTWLGNALGGDFGQSLFSGRDVSDMISSRIGATMSLTIGAVIVAVFIGVTTGMLSALYAGSAFDRVISFLTAAGLAVPEFWLGILLLNFLAVKLGLFPVVSWTPPSRDLAAWAQGLVLPCLSLGIAGSAVITRQMRGAMLETLDAPYVQTLRAIGTPRRTIILRYAFKNALVPVLTVMGFLTVMLIGGTFVIEKVFTVPGIGSLMLDAINRKDMPVVQGVTMVVAIWVFLIYLLLDIGYGILNPRVRPS
jgi:peptide/nickel transport system permease protein